MKVLVAEMPDCWSMRTVRYAVRTSLPMDFRRLVALSVYPVSRTQGLKSRGYSVLLITEIGRFVGHFGGWSKLCGPDNSFVPFRPLQKSFTQRLTARVIFGHNNTWMRAPEMCWKMRPPWEIRKRLIFGHEIAPVYGLNLSNPIYLDSIVGNARCEVVGGLLQSTTHVLGRPIAVSHCLELDNENLIRLGLTEGPCVKSCETCRVERAGAAVIDMTEIIRTGFL